MQVTDEMVEKAKVSLSHIRYGLSDTELRIALTAALSDKQAGEVKIKPLEWNPYRAETPFGWYEINDQRDVPDRDLKGRLPFLLCGSRMDYSRHATLEAARAAAQADFEQRIRSALVDVPAVEPVAYPISVVGDVLVDRYGFPVPAIPAPHREDSAEVERLRSALKTAYSEFNIIACEGVTETRSVSDALDRCQHVANRAASSIHAALAATRSASASVAKGTNND